jgi:hypothetical protein
VINTSPDGTSNSRLGLLDLLVCGYLVLPLLVFCTWFKWPAAVGLILLVCYGFAQALKGVQLRRIDASRRLLVMIAVVALAWTALAGTGHFFYANADWVIRDAVLRDLVATPWPPMYAMDGAAPLILRAPVGFYLPVAAIGSFVGLGAADFLLYLWTAFGFALVLWTAMGLFATSRERIICGVLLLGFGGLDVLGYGILRGHAPALGEHIEWWASFVQYSSNSTLLFWVPNHALPAWLGLLMVVRHWRTRELARMTLALAASIPLWSPLAAFGLVPFFLIGLNWRRDLGTLLGVRSGLPFLALAGLVARYVTMDSQSIVRGWSIDLFSEALGFWLLYGLFCLFEFGIVALLLARLKAFDLKVGVGVLILLMLPLYHFGPGNDLATRSSIPALLVLVLAAVRPLAASDRTVDRALLSVVLVVGMLGAAQEPARALLAPRWALTGKTLMQAVIEQSPPGQARLPANYVGHLTQPGLVALMRTPSLVRPNP